MELILPRHWVVLVGSKKKKKNHSHV